MVAQQRTPPSYIYMLEQGATTLWETWESTRYAPGASARNPAGHQGVPSWNHVMFGSISEWFFKHLAGIQQAAGGRGWDKITLRPQVWIPALNDSICGNLSEARGSVATSRGVIEAAWTCGVAAQAPDQTPHYVVNSTAAFTYAVQVPVGSTAVVHLPMMTSSCASGNVSESGTVMWEDGKFVAGAAVGVSSALCEGGDLVMAVGSGSYAFAVHTARF